MSKDQVSSRAVFQPVLDMSKFMEAEAAKKVEVLTRAFVSLNKAQSNISRGHNLNDYWNTQLSSIESVVSALEKFEKRQSGFGSRGYAEDFLKSYNSFIALGGQKSDVIAAYGSEFDALISKARELAPLVAETFAPDALKEAFRSFELMKELGVDLTDTFRALKAGSPDEINKALAEMNGRLIEAESRAERAEEALSRFGDVSSIDQIKTKLETLSDLQQNVKNEFDRFLSRSGLGDMIDSSQLARYYDNLAAGYETPMEAISRFRQEYYMLMAQVGQADMQITNGEFETFASTLQRITDEIAGLSSEITDMRAAMSGLGGGGGGEVAQGLAAELSQSVELSEAQKQAMAELAGSGDQLHTVIDVLAELIRTSGDAQTNLTGLSESVARMVESLSSLGSVEGDKLTSIATALRAISDIGSAQFDTKGINQLGPALSELGKVQNTATLQALTGVNLKGFNELHISKASLKNLADYLPTISTANVDVIRQLANIDFTKLKELKVSKSAVDNIKELFGITDQLNEAKRQIAEALGGTDTGNAAQVADIAKQAEDVADAEHKEADAAKGAADAEKKAADVAIDAAIAKQEKADAARKVEEAERSEAEAAVQASGAEATAAQAATDASSAKQAESTATADAVAAKQANAEASIEEAQAIQKVADAEREEQAAVSGGASGTSMFKSKAQEMEEMRETLESLYQAFSDDLDLGEHEDMLEKIMAAYEAIETAMKRIETHGESRTDIRGVRDNVAAIEQEVETYKRSADEARAAAAEKAEAAAQAAAKVQEEAEKEAKAVEASNKKLIASQEKAITAAYQKAEKSFSGDEQFKSIRDLYAEYEKVLAGTGYKKGFVSNEDVAKLNALRSELMALINALGQSESAHDEHAAATKRDTQEAERQTDAIKRQSANLRTSITRMFQSIPGLEDSEYGARLKEIRQELLDPDIDPSKYRELSAEVARLRSEFTEAGYAGSGFFGTLTMGVRNIAGFQVMLAGIRKVTSAIKKMTDAIKETDAAMTELKKVTDLTATGYEQFFKRATEASRNLGATVSDTINATADFARLGYDIDESLELARAALTYKNVGDGIDTVAQATESIISTIKAFRLEASNAMRVVDEFNEVGNKFAISSTGIGDALVRSASALQGAGNSLEESIGLITAANAIVQNPESVGTSLKTLTMFLRAAKLDLEAAGEDAEGCANSVAELREKLLELTKVDIMVDDSTFKSTYKIIQEISKEWDKLADVDKAAVTKLIGGKRNSNVVQALITNFQDAEKVVETASNAMGSATAENEEYLNSIAGKLDILKGNFEALSEAVVNSRIVKFCVDVLNAITQIATAIGGLPAILKAPITMFVLLAETITIWSKLGGVISKAFDALKAGSLTALTNPLSITVLSITAVIGAIVSWKDHVRKAREETIEAANESAKAFRDTTNSYTDGLDKLDKLEGRFKTLSKGVDENGKNVSLTADEYAEYKDIIQQIVDISPSIVQGYDSEKNMMLNYKDAINEARGALENLHKEESEEYFATGSDRLKGWRNEWKKADDALDKHSGMFMQFAFSDIAEDESRYAEYYALILDKLAEFNVLSKERVESLKDDALAYGAVYLNTDDLKALYDNAAAVKSALASITFTDFDGKEVHLFDQSAIQTDYNLIINLGNAIKNEKETADKLFEDIKLYVGEQEIFKSVGDAPWISAYYEQIKTLANEQLEAGDAAMSWADMQVAAVNTLKHAHSVFNDSDLVRDMQKDAEEYLDGAISLQEYEERLDKFKWYLNLANTYDVEGFGNDDDDNVFAIIIGCFESILSMSPSVGDTVDGATAKLTGFSDALKRITEGRSILDKAIKEMEESGGLSDETIDSITKALTDGEKLFDYLYTENGAVKLNTEAWEARAKAIAENDVSVMMLQRAELIRKKVKLDAAGDVEGSKAAADEIEELTNRINLYNAVIRRNDGVSDPLNLEAMFGSIGKVQDQISDVQNVIEGIGNGTIQSWVDVVSKFPEMTQIEGLFDIDLSTEDGKIQAVTLLYDKIVSINDEYTNIISAQIADIQTARDKAESAGDDLTVYDNVLNSLRALYQLLQKGTADYLNQEGVIDDTKQITDALNALSSAISDTKTAYDVLSDISDGEKSDIELLSEIIDLAQKSKKPLKDFISGFDGTKISFNSEYIKEQIDGFLEAIRELEDSDEKYKGLTERVKQILGAGEEEDPLKNLKDALSVTEKIISLVKDATENGISISTIQTLQDLFGEDWSKYLVFDDQGHYIGLANEALREYIDAENESAGATEDLKALYGEAFAAAISGAKDATTAIDVLSAALKGLQSAYALKRSIQSGSIVDSLERAFEIANNTDGIELSDLVTIKDGGIDFHDAGIDAYIDSLFDADTLKQKYPELADEINDEFLKALKNAVTGEIEAENASNDLAKSLDVLSTAISNASNVGRLIYDIGAGQKSDLEIFQSLLAIAKEAGKDVSEYIESFDEDGIHVNTGALVAAQNDLLQAVQELENAHPEFKGMTAHLKDIMKVTEESDAFGEALGKIDRAIAVVRNSVNNGITMETIDTLRDLFGEDWEGYLKTDEAERYIGLDIEKISAFIEEQKKAGETSVGVNALIAESWENAGKGIDDAADKLGNLTDAISKYQSMHKLFGSLQSGSGSFIEQIGQIIDVAKDGGYDISELISFDAGSFTPNVEKLRKYQMNLFSYENMKDVPGMTRDIALGIRDLVGKELEAADASEKLSNALSNISTAKGLLDNIRSGDGDFFSMFQTAMGMAQSSGQSVEDFFRVVNNEVAWNENAVIKWTDTWIDGLSEVDDISEETCEYIRNLARTQVEAADASERAASALDASKGALAGISKLDTNVGVNYEDFKSLIELSTEYAKAIEYNNGKMTLNRDKYNEVTAAVLKENLAIVENLKYEKQLGAEYQALMNARGQLDSKQQSRLDDLNAEIMGYEVLANEIRNAASAYQSFLSADTSTNADQFEAAQKAWQVISDTLYNKDSEIYGMQGREQYQEAVEFLVRPDIDDKQAKKVLDRYLSDAKDGVDNFVDDLYTNGLVDSDGYLNATVKTIADALGLTEDGVVAMIAQVNQYLEEGEKLEVKVTYTEENAKEIEDRVSNIQDTIQKLESGEIDINTEEGQNAVKQLDAEILNASGHAAEIAKNTDIDMTGSIQSLEDARAKVDTFKESIKDASESSLDVDTSQADADLTATEQIVHGIMNAIDDVSNHPFSIDTSDAQRSVGTVLSTLSNLIIKLEKLNGKTFSFTVQRNGSTSVPEGSTSAGGTGIKRGSSMATGFIGAPGGRTLVGELGREIVVDPYTNTWYTVGDHGAEFINMPRGAIVFNAEQTRRLLEAGRIPGRGISMISGNANASLTERKTEIVAGPLDRIHNNKIGNGAKSSGNRSGNNSSSSEKQAKETKDLIDWIEIAINRIERKISNLGKTASNTFAILRDRLSATGREIRAVTKEISVQEKGYKRYMEEADSVDLDDSLKRRVRDGAIDINEYDSDTKEKIELYKQWYEKAIACSDAIKDLSKNLSELYSNTFNMTQKGYENRLSTLENQATEYDNRVSASEYTGKTKPFKQMRDTLRERLRVLYNEAAQLQQKLDDAVNSGAVKKGSDAWYEMRNAIAAVKSEADETKTKIAELYKQAFEDMETKYGNEMSTISNRIAKYQNQVTMSDYTGDAKPFQKMIDAERSGLQTLNNEAADLQKKLDAALASGSIKKGSDAWYEMRNSIASVKAEAQQSAINIARYYRDMFDDIESRFSDTISLVDHELNRIGTMIKASDYTAAIKPFADQISTTGEKLKTVSDEAQKLREALKTAVDSGTIKEGSHEWFEMIGQIKSKEEEIAQLSIDISDAYIDAFNDIGKSYEDVMSISENTIDYIGKIHEASQYDGSARDYMSIVDMQQKSAVTLQKELADLEKAEQAALDSGAVTKGSAKWFEMEKKINDVKIKIKDTGIEISKTYGERFDYVKSQFDNLLSMADALSKTFSNMSSLSEFNGSNKPFAQQIDVAINDVRLNQDAVKRLEDALADAVNNGAVTVGSDEWLKRRTEIESYRQDAIESGIQIAQVYKDAFGEIETAFGNVTSMIGQEMTRLSNEVSASVYTGMSKPFADMIGLQKQDVSALEGELKGLETALKNAVDAGAIVEYSNEWYAMKDKIVGVSAEIQSAGIEIAKLYKDIFDDVEQRYGRSVALLGKLNEMLGGALEEIEARGYLGGKALYESMARIEEQSIARQQRELADLEKAMTDAIDSGEIKEGSEAWYEMQDAMLSVKGEIQNATVELINYGKAMRQIEWDRFDRVRDSVAALTEEADFLINLMESSELFSDNGQPTGTGNAQIGLHTVNYDVYMDQADKYADEIKSLNEEINRDAYDTKLIDRRNELLKLQRESILAAEQEKAAVKDLVEQGIGKELDALSELINRYQDSLDEAKDLYDYQKNIESQTKEIASLQKQLSAYSGDDSEENRARMQRLQVDLSDALDQLEETQYDRYISDQKKLLNDLYDDYERVLNQRLDDIDLLMREMIDHTNANSATIRDTLISETAAVGTVMTDAMSAVWAESGNAGAAIQGITHGVEDLYAASQDISQKWIADVEPLAAKIDMLGTDVKPVGEKLDLVRGAVDAAAVKTDAVNTSIGAMQTAVTAAISGIDALSDESATALKSDLKTSIDAIPEKLDGVNNDITAAVNGVSTDIDELAYVTKTNMETVVSQLALLVPEVQNIAKYLPGTAGTSSSGSGKSTSNGSSGSKTSSSSKSNSSSKSGAASSLASAFSDAVSSFTGKVKSSKSSGSVANAVVGYIQDSLTSLTKQLGKGTQGYAQGGIVGDLKKIATVNGDDYITINTLKRGDAVLTPEQAKQFALLTQSLPKLQGIVDISDRLRTVRNIDVPSERIDVGGITVTIPIDHVDDYNDFVKKLRDDRTFERMIQSMTVDPLVGKSTLLKKKYYN